MISEYKDSKGNKLFYKLVYRNQKKIVLSIKNNFIDITCPKNIKQKIVNDFISENIIQINELINRYKSNRILNFNKDNGFVFILGKKYNLILSDDNVHTKIVDNFILMKNKNNYLEQTKLLYSFFKKEYNNLFFELLNKWILITKEEVNELKIKNMISRWGICYNRHKRIILNIRLIHFSIDIIEYVILHELIHLKFPSHDYNFWLQVNYFLPNYKEKINYLKKYCI